MISRAIIDDGMIWIENTSVDSDGNEKIVTPVFGSREDFLKALGECKSEYEDTLFLEDEYNQIVKTAKEIICDRYKVLNMDDIFNDIDKLDEDDICELIDDAVLFLMDYQDYLAMSLNDKEILESVKDRLIPKDESLRKSYEKMDEDAKSEFSIADRCKDEWYWHIYNAERDLDDLCVIRCLSEAERKIWEKYGNEENTVWKDEFDINDKLVSIAGLRLAHKLVNEQN